jgi:PAS domain S-box-containing protein
MMLNANNSFLELFGYSSKEEVIGKTTVELKLFTEQGKYRVDNIINKANEVIKDFEVNIQKKEIRFGYQHLAETGD